MDTTQDTTQDTTTPRTVFMTTYGCQMNVLDSELVQHQMAALGYEVVDNPASASVVLINTCSVRDLAEQKVWSQLGRLAILKRRHKHMLIGVLGCMAERVGASILQRAPHVDVVCGPSNLDQLPLLLDNAKRQRQSQLLLAGHNTRRSKTLEHAQDGVEGLDLSRAFSANATNPYQAYVRITRGCNKFCSFCVVPFVRGAEVHRSPASIIEETKRLVDQGVVEVTLIGQTVNHYLYKQGERSTSFAELLVAIHEAVPSLSRLRFVTSYPRDFGDDALDAMQACPRICRYLHIPLQSGSNRILKLMNRGYTIEDYIGLLERARSRMPDISISGDMIAGFCSETDADHEASLNMLRIARYKSCFVFKYSPRSGTVAYKRLADDVPEEIKKVRNMQLLELQASISKEHHAALIGCEFDVLVEHESRITQQQEQQIAQVRLGWQKPTSHMYLVGHTAGDEIATLHGTQDMIGKIVKVRGVSATPLTVMTEVC